MTPRSLALPMLALFLVAPAVRAEEVDAEKLYQKTVKSCVFIVTPVKGGYAMGSGSLIDLEKRYVLTNYHVVDDEDTVFVQFPVYLKDGSIMTEKTKYIERIPAGLAIKGKVLHRDKSRDLAFIQLEKVPTGATAIPLAKKSVNVGATTWNIGSPGAVSQVFSITEGKVRAVGLQTMLVGGGGEVFEVKAKVVTTTNPTNQGDSGGPLFDKRGFQVAVTQSGRQGVNLVNNFICVTEVRKFLEEKKMSIKELSDEKDEVVGKADATKKDSSVSSNPAKNTETPKTTTPVASEADEKAATGMLSRARLFAEGDDNRPTYMAKLTEIVKKYPTTAAGKEAKKALDALK